MKEEISVREQDSQTGIDAYRLMPSMNITGRIVESEIEYLPVIYQLNKRLAR